MHIMAESKTPTLDATTRERKGTRYARRIRAEGKLPGVVYGHKQDPVSIIVDHRNTIDHLKHGYRVFNVNIDGSDEVCLVKDLQFDHLGTNVIHIDFTRIDLTEEIGLRVNLEFVGSAVGLKEPGATLQTPRVTLEVRCLATNVLTEALPVDVSGIEAGASMTAGEIPLPEGLRLDEDPDTVIAQVVLQQAEEEESVEGEEGIVGEAGAEGGDAAASTENDEG